MKIQKLPLSLAFVVAGAALLQPTAKAYDSVDVEAQQFDLILGFQTASPNTGNATNLAVDLGSSSLFQGLASGTVINLTAGTQNGATISAGYGAFSLNDLTSTYTSTPPALTFSVSGQGTGANELLFSNSNSSSLLPSSNQGPTYNALSGMIGGYNNAPTISSTSGSSGVFETAGDPGTYSGVAGANGTYGYAAFNIQTAYSASGTETFNLYDLQQGASSATELGTFTLNNSGNLTFTAQSVPELSSWLYGCIGLLMLVALQRCRRLQS